MSLTQLIIRHLMDHIKNIKLQLDKILRSRCFAKSVVLKELLKFLIEKSNREEVPKEFEITNEVFGKSNTSDKEKNIRIYVFNLRKKLKEYYENEGLNDLLIIRIPKGGYKVEVVRNRKIAMQVTLKRWWKLFTIGSLLLFIISIFILTNENRPAITKGFIWNEIYKSEHPLLFVLGDHYFFSTRNSMGSTVMTRAVNINSNEDFDKLLIEHPEVTNNLKKTEQTYINKQAPYGMYKIMSFLGGGSIDINMRYSSELSWEHLKENNTIFIGSYKTQGLLKQIFEKTGIVFNIKNSELQYTTKDTSIVYKAIGDDFLLQEFATLLRFELSDGRIVIALMCNSDVGNIATIKYLSELENLEELEKLTSGFSSNNFKAVFEVRGQQQTDFELNLIKIDQLQFNDLDKIWP